MYALRNVWESVRSSFWFVPSIMAMLAVVLAFGLGTVDRSMSPDVASHMSWIYTGGSAGARSVLSAIAGSVIGVAGTTFSIVIAVLSLTSGQFGPRLLRSFMRDFGNQLVLGTFTSTFLYCLLVLRTIRGTDDASFVPHLSVTVGVVMAVLSVGVLIYFINHVAESIQVSHLIETVGEDADAAVNRHFDRDPVDVERVDLPQGLPAHVRADRIGYVTSIDYEKLLRIASDNDVVVRLEVRPGHYVLPAMNLLAVWPGVHGAGEALRSALTMGRDRTTQQDVEFAFLQLSEIAVRALSPGINDPFTAIACIDRITASLCLVCTRFWPTGHHVDGRRATRLLLSDVVPGEIVEASYGHIARAAKATPAVLEKLRSSIATLLNRVGEPALRAALEQAAFELPPRCESASARGSVG